MQRFYIGLDPEFMVKDHLLIQVGERIYYVSWMLNFQLFIFRIRRNVQKIREIKGEADIYIFWIRNGNMKTILWGLTYFNAETNCAALLGMRYFGEHKKGTLTLAWAIANRNGYASCHGGQKRYNLEGGKSYVASVFGLSGSGKSTITHARHGGKYDITVLHDDAFIINTETCSSVALETYLF
jgi:phosphoenolpyruvate carboxykinase (ATP)